MMKFSLSDNKVIALLVTALILQILLLLWHMELITFSAKEVVNPSGVVAGTVENIENTLKRRPLDSLIWEESRAPEKVYFHDSILTLSESTARIHLQNGTQINLSENTLITIEPDAEFTNGEIRVRMAQGNLKARNPYQKAVIEDDLTSVKIEADSDVDLVKGEKGQVEVLVNKGKAEVVHNQKTYTVSKNERMVVNERSIQKDKISESVQWKDDALIRSYSHQEHAPVDLNWSGRARELIFENQGKLHQKIDLDEDQQTWSGNLPLGQYQASLVGEEGKSKNKEVQIWQAPKIQLVTPRPRDRVKSGQLGFVWTPVKEIASYELILKNEVDTLRFPTSLNKTTESVKDEGDYTWEIWGVDQKGFKIPPAYNYPLFIRENPFAPPKLKKPQLIQDKDSTQSSLWRELLFSKAWAAAEPVAVFSWEPVPGANLYFIEISQDKEFRTTVVKEKLREPQYQWKNFKEKEVYYWRVAAGDESGRMGLFSEPVQVDWDYVLPKKTNPPSPSQPNARPTPKEKPAAAASRPTQTALPPAQKVSKDSAPTSFPKKVEEETPRQYFKSASAFYMPGYGLKNYTENGLTKADLKGLNLFSGGMELEFFVTRQSVLRWYSKFQQVEYEPQPKSAFPFQPNVQSRIWINHLSWSPQSTSWGVGLWIADLPTLKRQNFEEVKIEQRSTFGILGEKTFEWDKARLISSFALISASSQFGVTTSQRLLLPLYLENLRVGVEVEGIFLDGGDNRDLILDAYFILGWKFE